MHRAVRSGLAVLFVTLGVTPQLAAVADTTGIWSAPVQLSTPIPPTDVVGGPSVAVNATGSEVAAWYDQAADGTQFVHVRTSDDGRSWSAPTTLGGGVSPAVAVAPDGRAVAVWEGLPPVTGTIQASVCAPGGTWSAPVTVTTSGGTPVVGVDGQGDAIAAWADNGGIETAGLPAGGSWTAVRNLATGGKGVRLAVNASGAAIVTWSGPTGAILADSGSVPGGFPAPVTVAAPAYRQGGPAVALNDSGQASLVWRGRTTALAATRTADGTWSAATQLTANASGSVSTAIDAAGDAIAAFVQYNGAATTFPVYVARRPAGGTWGTATSLSAPTDYAPAPQAIADPAGTFVVAWTDDDSSQLRARTAAPGAGFGPVTEVAGNNGPFALTAAPGHAALLWTTGGATISNEPIS